MASWKKVIVSGSNANLTTLSVDNLTSGQVVIGGGTGNLSTTAINGTGNIVATTGATGVSISGSFSGSFNGLIDSASFASTASFVTASGVFGPYGANSVISSSYAVNAGKVNNALTIGEGLGGAVSYDGSAAVTLTVSGAAQLTDNKVVKWNNTDNKFVDASLTDDGTTITGTTSIQLTGANSSLTGSFTGSFKGDGSQLTGLATTLDISGSNGTGISVNLLTQDLTIDGTANEIETSAAGTTITIGLPNDVTIGNNLTVTGDLTVNGTTTTVNTENLIVEDRFILLSSGSTSATDGGIIIQSSAGASGFAYGYDNTSDRWVYQDALSGNANAFGTITAYSNTTEYGASGTKPSDATGPAYGGATAGYGNTWVSTDTGEIWIYS